MDIVTPPKRSAMMAGIRGRDNRMEVFLRKALHREGFRYQLYRKDLPGKPDLVFPKYRAVVFVNGCFWHAHHCHLFKWPSTRPAFWLEKIGRNQQRDRENIAACEAAGWKVLVVWECAFKGKTRRTQPEIIQTTKNWLQFDANSAELEGYRPS
jgi:DNA mismatch endonuclease (patch repair protein)